MVSGANGGGGGAVKPGLSAPVLSQFLLVSSRQRLGVRGEDASSFKEDRGEVSFHDSSYKLRSSHTSVFCSRLKRGGGGCTPLVPSRVCRSASDKN